MIENTLAVDKPACCNCDKSETETETKNSLKRSSFSSSSSDDDGSTSSSSCSDVPNFDDNFSPPDASLATKIIEQVEFYFSDANIIRDQFLLKHVRKNKEGYVKLKLVSSFKKVKKLTKNWYMVAYALKHFPNKLEINTELTKVRRKEGLPVEDKLMSGLRTVVVTNLSSTDLTVESVKGVFVKFGTVLFVKIFTPKSNVPQEVIDCFAKNKIPSSQTVNSVIVEFSQEKEAHLAITEYARNWRGMQVFPLIDRSKVEPSPSRTEPEPIKKEAGDKRKQTKNKKKISELSSVSSSPSLPKSVTISSVRKQSESVKLSTSPWLQQRRAFMSANGSIPNSLGSSPSFVVGSSNSPVSQSRKSENGQIIPSGVLRLPIGPDGSTGFKPRTVQVLQSKSKPVIGFSVPMISVN